MRRYFAVVTPGIATGYWKAMNRPARARSSGSASVMSCAVEEDLALGDLEAGVAHDRVGQRRLAGPVRAHHRVDLAGADVEVHALEDLLLAGGDVQVSDLEVSHGSPGGVRSVCANSTSSAKVVPLQGLDDAHLHARPEQLGGAVLAVCVVRARDAAVAVVEEAVHRRDRALEREHDGVHRDLLGGAGEQVAAVRAARGLDQLLLLEQRGDPLEVGERKVLGLRDRLQAHRVLAALESELDQQPDAVLGLRREDHRG